MKSYIITLLILLSFFAKAQETDSLLCDTCALRKHIVKLRIISTIELINNVNRQIVGLEYEYNRTDVTSLVLDFDIGYFDKYIFYKYYDFFTPVDELPYTKRTVTTKGFHISPSYKYYFYRLNHTNFTGFSASAVCDYSYYNKNFDLYDSRTNISENASYNNQQFSLGGIMGLQMLIRNRVAIEISSSVFWKIFSLTSDGGDEINSKNSFWVSDNGSFWANYRIKIGYAFGKK